MAAQLLQRLQGGITTSTGRQHSFVLATRAAVAHALLVDGSSHPVTTVSDLVALLAHGPRRPQVIDISGTAAALTWGRSGDPPLTRTLGRMTVGAKRQALDLDTARSITDHGVQGVFVRLVQPRSQASAEQDGQTPHSAAEPTPASATANAAQAPQQAHAPSATPGGVKPVPPPAASSPSPAPPASTPDAIPRVPPPRLRYAAEEDVEQMPACPPGEHQWAQRAVVKDLIPKRKHCLPGETQGTLLTAFTTLMMRENADLNDPHTAQKVTIQRNVLHGLAALAPEVRTVVFTDSTVFADMAVALGMVVVTGVRSTSFGLPYLKAMYEWVEPRTSAPLHGYMNADILFGPRLIELLEVSLEHLEKGLVLPRLLLTGRRFNVQMPLPLPDTHADLMPADVSRDDLEKRIQAFRAKGAMFQADAEDYFFITRHAWKWSEIPDFVPGRAAYDNFLVEHAYRDQLERVDVTRCVFAIHQSGSDGHKAGLNRARAEPDFNLHAMNLYIGGYSKGRTDDCNIVLQCPAGQRIGFRRIPGRQRSGERGEPWTGFKYHGHKDPVTGKTYVCDNPGPRGQPVQPENKCHFK